MTTDFNYSIQNDFPNQTLDLAVLSAEVIQAIGTPALTGVTVTGDNVLISFGDDLSLPQETTLDGVVAAHQGVGFIEGVQRLYSESEQTTTSATDQVAATLNSGILAAGDYLVTWYAEHSVLTQDNLSGVVSRVLWNGTERAASANQLSFYTSFSGSVIITVTALDTPTFEVQYRQAGLPNTARIRRIRLSITRLNTEIEA